jgi:hypothetical protein
VATHAQRVGDVLGELQGPPQARVGGRRARRQPVERLGHFVAVGDRRRAVHEARRDQLHTGSAARQRGRQRVVVGEHVGRWIDELHAHPADILNH